MSTAAGALMKIRVLLIDDEGGVCEMLKCGLERTGRYEVGYATDGPTGLRMARTDSPDLILLDVCMPKMSGLEILRTLKSAPPLLDIPVIMFSGQPNETLIQECNLLYGEDYLTKPVTLTELKTRIESVLLRTGRLVAS